MDKLANLITDFYIKKNYIPKDKKEFYCYGFKLIIADIINFSIVIILGIILKSIADSLIFLLVLCGIRQFSGGFHAKTFWLCRLSMLITFLAVVCFTMLIQENFANYYILIVVNIICVIFIAVFSPVKHPNKKLTSEQKKKNKTKAIITSFISSFVSSALIIFKIDKGVTISLTLAAVVILMIIGIVNAEGRE